MSEFTPKPLATQTPESSGEKEPLWLSVSETAKVAGISTKTIRRAIQAKEIRYKLVKERYLIDFGSVVNYLNSDLKLRNKLAGAIGQYIENWKKFN